MAGSVDKKHKSMYKRLHSMTAHDWEGEKNKYKDIMDDGTMTFFWHAHTLTVLLIFTCILFYVAIFEEPSADSDFNMKRGITAMVLAFLLFGVTQTPDGPFRRPHPAFWRLVLCLSIVYELAMVYLLFQTPDDARETMKNFDSKLGVPLPEKSYGGNCLIYDANSTDPWHNLKDKMDGFVVTHFVGWFVKSLIIRDWWLCTIISLMFEVLEYTLEHQLPNFSECWWDHWIMDAIVCNGLGIYLGMKTLNYLSMKPYHWRGMWDIPSYSGKMKRMALQFTPYSWTDFNWRPTSSLIRWFACLGITSVFLLAELNTFYLKFVLWLPPDHYLCLGRLVFLVLIGAVSMREGFQFLDDPECKKFGRQSWLMIAIVTTEFLVAIKFDPETISKPLPMHIAYTWILGVIGLVVYTIWRFYIKRDVKNNVHHEDEYSPSVQENDKERVYNLRSVNNNGSEKVRFRVDKKNGSAGF